MRCLIWWDMHASSDVLVLLLHTGMLSREILKMILVFIVLWEALLFECVLLLLFCKRKFFVVLFGSAWCESCWK